MSNTVAPETADVCAASASKQLTSASVLQISEHRGNPRLWLQGHAPERAGFVPGARFDVLPHAHGVVLQLAQEGARTVSRKARKASTAPEATPPGVAPVVDVNSAADLAALGGTRTVRVAYGKGVIYISPLASEVRRTRRLAALRSRLASGAPLRTASVAAGAGVLAHAVHAGLAAGGLASEVAVFNEIRPELCEQALEHNRCLGPQTVVLNMPLQELAFDNEVLARVGEVDLVELGLPCSGASVAGRAKRGLVHPEAHPDVGHLAAPALALLVRLNPVVAIFENVPQYASTASACILRQQLRDLGYVTHERELLATDFGDLEARKRWAMVAVTRGVDFDLATLTSPGPSARTLADVLEPAHQVADRWSEMRGLKDKEVRDLAEGKNFRMQVYTGSESSIGTLTKGLSKNRSTDPKIQHPDRPELLRVPTVSEHARIKGVPPELVQGLSFTVGHQLLGQAVCVSPFQQLARHVAKALLSWGASGSNVAWNTPFAAAA